ncbi:amidohydrolase family protein [Amycolatopsis pithecellobii]|uniref:Amidohydrolase family protein n=1 Tax=Amycolatopsis pithecellobii TaxID=664692 RepID=A0A6N7Z2H1_9PSEU|nr:amidohydrolase family protein [Amycolatopsis pithecellobii]MTD54004.1 amidohydrolase family protein [Amycolatopsis pithecellobii]
MSGTAHEVSRVIAVEEHVWSPELRGALLELGGDDTVDAFSNDATTNRLLLDAGEERLARMDAAGVDFQVLSITSPGTQQLPAAQAVSVARISNDFLADAVRRHPGRFAAFATLPTPDPAAAADELHRCVTELGFVGAMLFPRTGPDYLDHKSHRPIFDAAAELDVPVYIHPGVPPEAVREALYGGFDFATNLMLSTGGWGWHADAGLAALRLILAGTFDRHPDLQIILGHWGEMLVSFADRADGLSRASAHLERRILDYITGNVYATAGGIFSHRMLRQVLDVVGPDRIMFAVDDPYTATIGSESKASPGFARAFIETAPIGAEDKAKLAHRNAERFLLKRG